MRKKRFKVGDIIRANEESNSIYWVTKQKNKWVGIVIAIINDEDGNDIKVETLECTRGEIIGMKYEVKSQYFDYVENIKEATEKANELKTKIKEILDRREK